MLPVPVPAFPRGLSAFVVGQLTRLESHPPFAVPPRISLGTTSDNQMRNGRSVRSYVRHSPRRERKTSLRSALELVALNEAEGLELDVPQ